MSTKDCIIKIDIQTMLSAPNTIKLELMTEIVLVPLLPVHVWKFEKQDQKQNFNNVYVKNKIMIIRRYIELNNIEIVNPLKQW